jgi:uncharacterized hydrophobic protein (TIGR00271 family)
MLQVRVVSPAHVTERLVDSLTADSGVVNLVVLPAAAARPPGDAVQFDLMNASANGVLRQLRSFGLDRDSSVAVQPVDTTMADDATLADRARLDRRQRFYHGERAPVWELVQTRIAEGAEYAPSFFALLVFAGLIGACGILTNSQILIVGAMVVGPEYSAIISVADGIDRRDTRAIVRGISVLFVGFLLAIAVTLLFALCIKWSGKTPGLYLSGLRPVSDLINSPNVFSVVVAVVAGIVGVVSMTLSKTGALIGVFISITTIPAAADIGVSLAYRSWSEAVGSVEQLLLNVGLLIIVGAVALRGQRLIWRDWERRIPPRPLARVVVMPPMTLPVPLDQKRGAVPGASPSSGWRETEGGWRPPKSHAAAAPISGMPITSRPMSLHGTLLKVAVRSACDQTSTARHAATVPRAAPRKAITPVVTPASARRVRPPAPAAVSAASATSTAGGADLCLALRQPASLTL